MKLVKQYFCLSGSKIYWIYAAAVILSTADISFRIRYIRQYGEVCLKDFLIQCSAKTSLFTVIPLLVLINLLYLHKFLVPSRVVRYRHTRFLYIRAVLEQMLGTAITTGAIFLLYTAYGLFYCNFRADNWNNPASYARCCYDQLLVDTPLPKLAAAIYVSWWIISLILSLFCMILYRYIKNLPLSYVICMLVHFWVYFDNSALLRRYSSFHIKSSVYLNGWQAVSLAAPLTCTVLLFIWILMMGKPDWR